MTIGKKRPAKKNAARKAKAKRPRSRKAKLRQKTSAAGRSGYQTNWRIARDPARSVRERVEAFAMLTNAICDDQAVFNGTLQVLRDTSTEVAVRLAALSALQAASFAELEFAPYRPAYTAALRAVAKDPDAEVRTRVLGLLARAGDGKAQSMLLDGLKDPTKALVPPEKALQLLSYDIKAEAYPVARKIVDQPPNADAKVEALRLLAADPKSAPVFEKILRDKKELPEVRQISAAALQSLAPQRMHAHAREIVLDSDESPDLQATSLIALAQFGKSEELAVDDSLNKRVQVLQESSAPEVVRQSAKEYTSKFRP